MDNHIKEAAILLEEWNGVKTRLEELFHERKQKNTLELMKQGINLFVQFLYFSNGQPNLLVEQIPYNQLSIKPVNLEERLGFIISRPSLYHSFRQLSELMVEQEKLYVKMNIMKKSSN